MIRFILLVVAATLVIDIQALYSTVNEFQCNGNGQRKGSCKVKKVSTRDIIYLEASLINQTSPNNACNKDTFNLNVTPRGVFLVVAKDCMGYFKILKAECGVSEEDFRIINGRIASSCRQFPWMARVNDLCGASIINRNHVLTAAHCVADDNLDLRDPSIYTITTGTTVVKTGKKIGVEKIFLHEEFNNSPLANLVNDIAVLRLKEDIKFDECQRPICLASCPHKVYVPGIQKSCVVSGWGAIDSNVSAPNRSPKDLHWVRMQMLSYSECYKTYAANSILGGLLCAKGRENSQDHTGHCGGDSGGPLICQQKDNRWDQYGVVSVNRRYIPCGAVPGGYTNVPHFYHWILSKVNSP